MSLFGSYISEETAAASEEVEVEEINLGDAKGKAKDIATKVSGKAGDAKDKAGGAVKGAVDAVKKAAEAHPNAAKAAAVGAGAAAGIAAGAAISKKLNDKKDKDKAKNESVEVEENEFNLADEAIGIFESEDGKFEVLNLSEAEYTAVMEARAALEESGVNSVRAMKNTKIAKKGANAAAKLADIGDKEGAERAATISKKAATVAKKSANAAAKTGEASSKAVAVQGAKQVAEKSTKAAEAVKNNIQVQKKMTATQGSLNAKKILAMVAAGAITATAATVALNKIAKAVKAKKDDDSKKKGVKESVDVIYTDEYGIEETVELSLEEFAAISESREEVVDENVFELNTVEYEAVMETRIELGTAEFEEE